MSPICICHFIGLCLFCSEMSISWVYWKNGYWILEAAFPRAYNTTDITLLFINRFQQFLFEKSHKGRSTKRRNLKILFQISRYSTLLNLECLLITMTKFLRKYTKTKAAKTYKRTLLYQKKIIQFFCEQNVHKTLNNSNGNIFNSTND